MNTVYVLSGGFDPLHSGHISMFKSAASKADAVIVGVNSDSWLIRKKGKPFMSLEERLCVVSSNRHVTAALTFDDSDNTAINLLEQVKSLYPSSNIIFGNGGDRTADNIPELAVSGIQFEFGIGGEYKKNSSSSIIENFFSYERATRQWGEYFTIFKERHSDTEYKLKKIIVEPGKSMSLQLHEYRNEIWVLVDGEDCLNNGTALKLFDPCLIPAGEIHRFENMGTKKATLIEIQHGNLCSEYDIKRFPK